MAVVIEGMEQALKQFREAPKLARKYIGEAVKVTEMTTAGKVRAMAPRRTGALALSIGSKTVGLRAQVTIEQGELYGQRPEVYWRFVEFGAAARGIAANPFIRPSAESEADPFIARVKHAGVRMERDLRIP